MSPKHIRLGVVALALAAVASGVAGCSGHETSPTVPSSSAATAAPAPGASQGSTIMGTVVGASGASSMAAAQSAAMTVNVTGSTISATVDMNGRFTLSGVPAGHVDLHFVGAGVDAHLAVDVADHTTLVITVQVSGNQAHLTGDDHDNNGASADVSGQIVAGSISGSCAAHTLSFVVGTTRVVTNASTQFEDSSCGSLAAGTHVEVKGARQADNSVLASSVEGDDDENDNDEPGNGVELKGIIAAGTLSGSCAGNSLSFRVGSTLVRTNASTRFEDTSCASLKAGDAVEVKGSRQSDASVLASRVDRDD